MKESSAYVIGALDDPVFGQGHPDELFDVHFVVFSKLFHHVFQLLDGEAGAVGFFEVL